MSNNPCGHYDWDGHSVSRVYYGHDCPTCQAEDPATLAPLTLDGPTRRVLETAMLGGLIEVLAKGGCPYCGGAWSFRYIRDGRMFSIACSECPLIEVQAPDMLGAARSIVEVLAEPREMLDSAKADGFTIEDVSTNKVRADYRAAQQKEENDNGN